MGLPVTMDNKDTHGAAAYVLAPGLLSLRTNHMLIHDLAFGNLPA